MTIDEICKGLQYVFITYGEDNKPIMAAVDKLRELEAAVKAADELVSVANEEYAEASPDCEINIALVNYWNARKKMEIYCEDISWPKGIKT